MTRLKTLKRVMACIACGVLSIGLISYNGIYEKPVSAMTSSELQAQKAANAERIASLQSQMDSLTAQNVENKEYKKLLEEKIDTQQKNLKIVNEENNRLKEDILDTRASIDDLQADIDAQEESISEGMDNFKKRLRAIYVTGNDSLASAVAGSTDFYDMLSKYELISQVAKHDNELVNGLKAELNEIAQNKMDLEKKKSELVQQQEEKEAKRDEMKEAIEELNSDYEQTEEQIKSNEMAAASASHEVTELEQTNESLAVEIESLQEQESIEAVKASEAAEAESISAAAEKKMNSGAERPTAPANDSEETTTTTYEEAETESYEAAEEVQTEAQEEVQQEVVEEQQEEVQPEAQEEVQTEAQEEVQTEQQPETQPETEAPTEAETEAETQPEATGDVWSWPAPASYNISSGFGYRWGTLHKGIDIAGGVQGTAACASRAGTVIKVVSGCSHNYPKSSSCGCGGGYGNYVIISHDGTYSTLYGHLASVNVSVGQQVSAGQQIGVIGSTGHSTGYHLHFEIRVNGSPTDPTQYLY